MNQTIITEDDLIFMKKIDDEEAERSVKYAEPTANGMTGKQKE